ncbi:MAG TPA: hypothetical protein VGJ15_08190 [Pirellulales bacterium]
MSDPSAALPGPAINTRSGPAARCAAEQQAAGAKNMASNCE